MHAAITVIAPTRSNQLPQATTRLQSYSRARAWTRTKKCFVDVTIKSSCVEYHIQVLVRTHTHRCTRSAAVWGIYIYINMISEKATQSRHETRGVTSHLVDDFLRSVPQKGFCLPSPAVRSASRCTIGMCPPARSLVLISSFPRRGVPFDPQWAPRTSRAEPSTSICGAI